MVKRICVNCGSNPGFKPCYMNMAKKLGQAIVDHGLDLVYGGADVGLMGEVANTVLKGKRAVIGVIPKSFADKVSHQGLTELHVVDSMHERKTMMFDLSDAFVALPGGFGTRRHTCDHERALGGCTGWRWGRQPWGGLGCVNACMGKQNATQT